MEQDIVFPWIGPMLRTQLSDLSMSVVEEALSILEEITLSKQNIHFLKSIQTILPYLGERAFLLISKIGAFMFHQENDNSSCELAKKLVVLWKDKYLERYIDSIEESIKQNFSLDFVSKLKSSIRDKESNNLSQEISSKKEANDQNLVIPINFYSEMAANLNGIKFLLENNIINDLYQKLENSFGMKNKMDLKKLKCAILALSAIGSRSAGINFLLKSTNVMQILIHLTTHSNILSIRGLALIAINQMAKTKEFQEFMKCNNWGGMEKNDVTSKQALKPVLSNNFGVDFIESLSKKKMKITVEELEESLPNMKSNSIPQTQKEVSAPSVKAVPSSFKEKIESISTVSNYKNSSMTKKSSKIFKNLMNSNRSTSSHHSGFDTAVSDDSSTTINRSKSFIQRCLSPKSFESASKKNQHFEFMTQSTGERDQEVTTSLKMSKDESPKLNQMDIFSGLNPTLSIASLESLDALEKKIKIKDNSVSNRRRIIFPSNFSDIFTIISEKEPNVLRSGSTDTSINNISVEKNSKIPTPKDICVHCIRFEPNRLGEQNKMSKKSNICPIIHPMCFFINASESQDLSYSKCSFLSNSMCLDMFEFTSERKSSDNSRNSEMVVKNEIYRLSVLLTGPLYINSTVKNLKALQSKYPEYFGDLCLYNKIVDLMWEYKMRIEQRRIIHELFSDALTNINVALYKEEDN